MNLEEGVGLFGGGFLAGVLGGLVFIALMYLLGLVLGLY